MAANPLPEADDNPESLPLTFLNSKPKRPDIAALNAVKKASGAFELEGKVFYFYAPEGVGRSKAFSKIESSRRQRHGAQRAHGQQAPGSGASARGSVVIIFAGGNYLSGMSDAFLPSLPAAVNAARQAPGCRGRVVAD